MKKNSAEDKIGTTLLILLLIAGLSPEPIARIIVCVIVFGMISFILLYGFWMILLNKKPE